MNEELKPPHISPENKKFLNQEYPTELASVLDFLLETEEDYEIRVATIEDELRDYEPTLEVYEDLERARKDLENVRDVISEFAEKKYQRAYYYIKWHLDSAAADAEVHSEPHEGGYAFTPEETAAQAAEEQAAQNYYNRLKRMHKKLIEFTEKAK